MNITLFPKNNVNYGKKYYNTDKMLRAFGEQIGQGAKKNLERKIEQANCKNSGLVYDVKNSIIEISNNKDNLFKNVVCLPLDITNSIISCLKKNKLMRNSKLLNSISDSKLLKLRKIEVENSSNIASIEKCLKSFDGEKFDKNFFKNIHSRLNLKVGNYDSSSEKALTRLCTGIVPAFFLANDAYNLSSYVSNNRENAENSYKSRLKQELTRIGITSISMFLALKSFSKTSNKSANAVTSIIAGVTILSEIIGRKFAGNPIFFLHKKSDIEKYAKKRKIDNNSKINLDNKNAKNESILNLKNIIASLSIMIAAGYSADKLSKIPAASKLKSMLIKNYSDFMKKDYKISKTEFEDIISLLKKNGFEGLADKYDDIVKSQAKVADDNIIIGRVIDKSKYIPIHQILTFPIRFAWKIINFPYSKILKPLFIKNTSDFHGKATKQVSDIEILQNSLSIIKKNKNKDNFAEILNKKLLSSLDYETKSSVSNAGLSVRTKKVASIASSTFLIADNYNSVMIESGGENKDLAIQKGKERAIQRIVRIIYGTFFTTLFNTVFESAYNSSLLGAQAVNIADSLVLETMERRAVGLPLRKSDRASIVELENKYLNAGGLKGAFSRLTAKITGKKPITQRAS